MCCRRVRRTGNPVYYRADWHPPVRVLLPPVPQYIFARGFRPPTRVAFPRRAWMQRRGCVSWLGGCLTLPWRAAWLLVAPGGILAALAGCTHSLLAGCTALCYLTPYAHRSLRSLLASVVRAVAPGAWLRARVPALPFFVRTFSALSLSLSLHTTLHSASQGVRSLLHFATRSCSLSLSLPDIRIGLYLVFRFAPPSVKSNLLFIINYL